MIPPTVNVLTFFPPDRGMLRRSIDAFIFFFKYSLMSKRLLEEKSEHNPDLLSVVSHIQRVGCQPEKTSTLHGGQSRSWSAEQGEKNVWQRTPPTLLVRRK